MKGNLFAIIFSCILILQSGCTAVQPFPSSTRAGDTITLAVGSPEGMTTENTSVYYTPDSTGVARDISSGLRSVVKIYPDKTSRAAQAGVAKYIPYYTGHEPWLNVMVLDLPSDLTVGPGEIQVSTPATYHAYDVNINDITIPVNIIGTGGTPSTFSYYSSFTPTTGDLTDLDPLPQFIVRPVFEGDSAYILPYGAVEIIIDAPGIESLADHGFNVVPMDMDATTRSQTRMSWSRNGSQLKILFVSANASMKYYEANCSIVFNTADISTISPTITSVRFFDENGEDALTSPVMEIVSN